jgi:ABC-2 type transport system ATP-binding protein
LRKVDMQDKVVEIKNLSKIYKASNFTAVDHVNLCVYRGEVFGFLGSNGAGKTTTIKMTCGLITPTNGSIFLNGYDVLLERSEAMRQIGVVLEGTRNIYWTLSAWHNLMYFGKLKGCSGRRIKERGEQLLQELELWDRRNDITKNFSRGMQQRVAIACALIADPPILILDEPTLGLDVEATQIVRALLSRLARDYKKTIIITSHQLDVVQELCDRVAIMHKGRIIEDKSVAELRMLFGQDYYQIKIQGYFNNDWRTKFDGFTITEDSGMTSFTGPIFDKTKLYSLIDKIRESDVEEVFLKLVKNEKGIHNHGNTYNHG